MLTPAQLAVRHLKLTFWGGVVLAVPVGLLVAISMERRRYWPDDSFPLLHVLGTAAGITGVLVLWAALPALVAGWLRLRPMRWLFGWLRQHQMRFGWLVGVGGTFLLFTGTILLGTLLLFLFGRGRITFIMLLRACTGFSLPWLLASLWATWRMLRSTPGKQPR
jgi:hypothetical protein